MVTDRLVIRLCDLSSDSFVTKLSKATSESKL